MLAIYTYNLFSQFLECLPNLINLEIFSDKGASSNDESEKEELNDENNVEPPVVDINEIPDPDASNDNEDPKEAKINYGKLCDRENRPENKYKLLYAQEFEKRKSSNVKHKTKNKKLEDKHRKWLAKKQDLLDEIEVEKKKVLFEKARVVKEKLKTANERSKNSKLSKKLEKLNTPKAKAKIVKKGVEDLVAKSKLTKAQQRVFINPDQKWAKCSDEDICQALVIRCLSPKTFEMLRKEKKLYYPSKTTIERHLDGMLRCNPG